MNIDKIAKNLIKYRLHVQTIDHNRNSCLHASVVLDEKSCLKEGLFWT
jgi:hypothetical protein